VEDTGCAEGCPDGTLRTIREIEGGAQYTAAQINHLVGLYDGEIAFTDQEIGRLLGRLDQFGLAANTLVVLTSDHGQSFAEHDHWLSGESVQSAETRVPLVVAMPGRVPAAAVVSAPASSADLAPTILDIIGLEVPDRFEGQSLLPLMLGHSTGDDRLAVTELADRSQVAIVDRSWKLIWTAEDQTARLYNLLDDPNELNDRAAEEPRITAQLLEALVEWRALHPN
jgi:arylsulfatase A-like enzyme